MNFLIHAFCFLNYKVRSQGLNTNSFTTHLLSLPYKEKKMAKVLPSWNLFQLVQNYNLCGQRISQTIATVVTALRK